MEVIAFALPDLLFGVPRMRAWATLVAERMVAFGGVFSRGAGEEAAAVQMHGL